MDERHCEIHWVPVTDASGRCRMEMRWAAAAAHAVVTTLPVTTQVSRAA